MERDYEMVADEKADLEEKLGSLNFKKINLQEQKETYQTKRASLEFADLDAIHQYDNRSVRELINLVEQSSRLRKKVTAKDRVLLEKLDQLKEKYLYNKRIIRDLEKNEEEIQKLIGIFGLNFVY